MRQGVTSENLFVLFIFCNPTDNCDGKGNRTSLITNKTTAWLSHRNKLFRRIRDCLYISCSSLWQFSKMFLFINQFLINFFGQLHTFPACFTTWEKDCSKHWIGIQIDPRASLGILEVTVSITLLSIIWPASMYWPSCLDYSIDCTLGFPETGVHKFSINLGATSKL